MRRFRKKSQFDMIILPREGCVKDDRILEGDGFSKYKLLLDELPAEVSIAVVAPGPAEPVKPYHTVEAEEGIELIQELQRREEAKVKGTSSLDDALDFAEESAPVKKRRTRTTRKKEVSA